MLGQLSSLSEFLQRGSAMRGQYVAALAVITMISTFAYGQETSKSIPRPDSKAGDSWVFDSFDGYTGQATGSKTETVTGVSESEVVTESSTVGALVYTREWMRWRNSM